MNMQFRNAILTLLVLITIWFSSLWLYDSHKSRDAEQWRQAVLAGETPYRWTFDARTDITSGHGIEDFEWQGGELSGDLDDPYIYLNLRASDAIIHFSDPIPVEAGAQVIELDLLDMPWQTRNVYLPADTAQTSIWGSPEGHVSALRIDPVLEGGFALSRIELLESGPAVAANPGIIPFSSPHDPALNALSRTTAFVPLLAHDRFWRTPETAHATRMAIAERFPSAILFPKPPGEAGQAYRILPQGWLPGLLFLSAMLLFAACNRLPTAWRDKTQLAAYLVMIGSFLFLEPALIGGWKILPVLPLAAATWWLRPGPGSVGWPGDPGAWKYLAPMIILSLVLLVTLYERGPEDSPLWEVLAIYLGWALIQQYLVAAVVFGRLRGLAEPYAVVMAAAFFAFMHLPNFALMVATFVLGLYLLPVYRRYPNLPALAVTHALAAVSLNASAPGLVWLSREIGPRFLQGL
jgi:hypothetical protein